MPDELSQLMIPKRPTAERPLQGLTILVVEDSRFASEAMRLLCLRSGARIRRADTLMSARRHLSLYRPSVAIVDLGLPDGDGIDLIRELDHSQPRVAVLLAISGAAEQERSVIEAGAQGFLLKPVTQLAQFQQAILEHLPPDLRPAGPRVVSSDHVLPDTLALRDDLSQLLDLMHAPVDAAALTYVAQFMASVARSAGDDELGRAAEELFASQEHPDEALTRISDMVEHRIKSTAAI